MTEHMLLNVKVLIVVCLWLHPSLLLITSRIHHHSGMPHGWDSVHLLPILSCTLGHTSAYMLEVVSFSTSGTSFAIDNAKTLVCEILLQCCYFLVVCMFLCLNSLRLFQSCCLKLFHVKSPDLLCSG